MTNRLISLTVSAQEPEEWYRTFQELSELAANMGATHNYVGVSVSSTDTDLQQFDEEPENLYYDDKTIEKVRRILEQHGANSLDVVTALQNAGILFRERR